MIVVALVSDAHALADADDGADHVVIVIDVAVLAQNSFGDAVAAREFRLLANCPSQAGCWQSELGHSLLGDAHFRRLRPMNVLLASTTDVCRR